MNLQVPSHDTFSDGSEDKIHPNRTRISKVWMTFFNRVKSKFSAMSAIGATTSPTASDPATTQALANELKTKWDALIAALNNDQ